MARIADRLSRIAALWYPFCWVVFFFVYVGVWVARPLKARAKKPPG